MTSPKIQPIEIAPLSDRPFWYEGDDKAELRERLGIAAFDPTLSRAETISADADATRLGICVGSVQKLIRNGVLPAMQLMPSAPWQIPVAALETEVVKTGIREIVARRPKA